MYNFSNSEKDKVCEASMFRESHFNGSETNGGQAAQKKI